MGSGFKSRGVHHRNPVFIATSHEGGVSLCHKLPQGIFMGYLFRRISENAEPEDRLRLPRTSYSLQFDDLTFAFPPNANHVFKEDFRTQPK
jgi:hypothetical protein